MKALIVLLFFLVSGCPLDKLKTGSSKSKKGAQSSKSVEREVAYETPPHAPIPPEKYCYELHSNAQGVTKLELTVTLDSVLGKLDHFPARANEPNGILIGTIYDGTLLVSYQYTFDVVVFAGALITLSILLLYI